MSFFAFTSRFVSLFAFLLLAFAFPNCSAQTVTTGEVTGTAVDAGGAVIKGASVVLRNIENGEERTAICNGAGVYLFPFVRPGTYELSASSVGLASDITRVQVQIGQVQSADLELKIQEVKQSIIVTARSSLDSDNAQTTYTLTDRQLDELPLPGGDLVAVAYAVPGVVLDNHYGWGNFALQGIGSVSNLFTVNGAEDMNPYRNVNNAGVNGLLLGANELQDVSVIQNAYEGQYGRQVGAQVNYVTKSGTNTVHGNLAYTYGGDVLNANNFPNNSDGIARPKMVSNEYAASLGGPLLRNRLFFFVDTEGLRTAGAAAAKVVVAPSKALEQYTLAAIQPSQIGFYKKVFDLYDSIGGRNLAGAVTNGGGRLQDSSGRLGCGAFVGTSTGFGGKFGQDVSCADAWMTTLSQHIPEWLASVRLDYNLNDNQHVYLRFKTDHGFAPTQLSLVDPVFNVTTTQPDYEAQLNHTLALTPRLTNNFTAALSYYSYTSRFGNLAAALKALPFQINIRDGGTNGGSFTSIGGFAQYPQGSQATNLQFVDDLSYAIGRHWIQTGVNYRGTREADFQFAGFSEFPAFQLNRLGDFADGIVNSNTGSTYVQHFPRTPVLHIRLHNIGFYVQDQWAASSSLKLTAALRFDRSANPECSEYCFSRLKAPFAELGKGASIPYDQSIEDDLAHPFYSVDPITVEPRFSFAYSPGSTKSMVIRGGVGLFSDLYPASFASALAGNAPNVFGAVIRQGIINFGGAGSAPAIAAASAAAFNASFAAGATLSDLQKAVAPATYAAPSYYSVPSTLHTPKFLEWNAEVDHEIGSNNVVSLRYTGNHGYDLFLTNGSGNAAVNVRNYPNGFGGLPLSTPDPRFSAVAQLTNGSYSNYNGMTALLRRTFGSSLQGQISYTWGHSLDLLSNGGILNFAYDSLVWQMDPTASRRLNYSSSDYDVRHSLTLDFIWQLPIKPDNRLLRSLLGGWGVAGTLNAHTGTPFSVFDRQIAGRATTNLATSAVLADVTDPYIHFTCGHSSITTSCFTAAQFATPATQTDFGNFPRNSFRGPGYFDTDTSLYKTVPIRERVQLTIGASAFNLLNHTNLADPQQDVASPGLGLTQFAGAPPSGPFGAQAGPTGRALVVTGKLAF